MYLIGLDIGTTSIGGVLVDGNSGEIVKSMIKEAMKQRRKVLVGSGNGVRQNKACAIGRHKLLCCPLSCRSTRKEPPMGLPSAQESGIGLYQDFTSAPGSSREL